MIARRLFVAALVLLASCQENCRCNDRGSAEMEVGRDPIDKRSGRARALAVPGERLSLRAKGRDAIELGITRAELRVGHVAFRASGPRSAWVYALAIDDAIQDEGGRLTLPQGGRCVVRYLDEGRATEADFTIHQAEVQLLSRGPFRLRAQFVLQCRKRFSATTTGTPYAASLPDEIDILGVVTLLRRD